MEKKEAQRDIPLLPHTRERFVAS